MILPIKGIKQKRHYSCGPTCIQMVLKYYGVEKKQKEIVEDLHCNAAQGTYPCQLRRYLKLYGIETIKTKKLGRYVPEPMIIGERGHFELLIGMKKDKYAIIDPSTGRRRLVCEKKLKKEMVDVIKITEVKYEVKK